MLIIVLMFGIGVLVLRYEMKLGALPNSAIVKWWRNERDASTPMLDTLTAGTTAGGRDTEDATAPSSEEPMETEPSPRVRFYPPLGVY